MTSLSWSVDTLVIRSNIIFGYGWACHPVQTIRSIQIGINSCQDDQSNKEYISAEIGKHRADVATAFPEQENASSSGYIIYGAFTRAVGGESLFISFTLDDKTIIHHKIPHSSISVITNEGNRNSAANNLLYFKNLVSKAIPLIKSGKFSVLKEKTSRLIRNTPNRKKYSVKEIISVFEREKIIRTCLIIDHDLGGGANLYRRKLVADKVSEGYGVVVLTHQIRTLSFIVTIITKTVTNSYAISLGDFLSSAVSDLGIVEIFYNTAVSFPLPEEIPRLLVQFRIHEHEPRLIILLHDFYAICPSHFLIDYSGKHCFIPKISDCQKCLNTNNQSFVALFRDRNIQLWRNAWKSALLVADEIVAFSESSKKILLKVYVDIPSEKVSVRPHRIEHLPKQKPKVTSIENLKVGVVGQIGFHKGSSIVQSLANHIVSKNLEIKIVVIGTIEADCDRSVVSQTGHFAHKDLPDLIEKSGANIFFLPSIFPETFSYVVHELIAMDLPVVAFNLGAPLDSLSQYPKGLLLDSPDPSYILTQLIFFHRQLYLSNKI